MSTNNLETFIPRIVNSNTIIDCTGMEHKEKVHLYYSFVEEFNNMIMGRRFAHIIELPENDILKLHENIMGSEVFSKDGKNYLVIMNKMILNSDKEALLKKYPSIKTIDNIVTVWEDGFTFKNTVTDKLKGYNHNEDNNNGLDQRSEDKTTT